MAQHRLITCNLSVINLQELSEVIKSSQSLTFGGAYHLVDYVNACDALSDWMFNLQPSVHLQEIELALPVNKELHRAYTAQTPNAVI